MTPRGVCFSRATPFVKTPEFHVHQTLPLLTSFMAALQMSSQRSNWRERLHVNRSRMEHEIALKLQDDRVNYLTQVEIPVTTADFYFPLEPREILNGLGK